MQMLRGGFPVFERHFGHGDERAVLLHCALAQSKSLSRLADGLSDRLTMIAPDMPGHGRSAAWDHRCNIHDQVTAIARDCLGKSGHVVGHSFGATVALRVALENPRAVRSLTLIEPVLFAAAQESDPAALQSYRDDAAAFAEALRQEDWETAAQAFTAVWGDGRSWQGVREAERARFTSQMHFIRETEEVLLHDHAGLLSPGRPEQITCPTLLVRGADTHPIIAVIHQTLARRIPNASEVVIPGAGHMVPITHPDPVAQHIKAILNAAARQTLATSGPVRHLPQ
ncbi:alpha/beta hydrolase [Marivita sp. S6314]|uniref:alpha/beta fold hydrolase n=1 Tax=Marivita sp. S6314 TaxID=2926406 RepID=UPI001FF35C29|nr:alpha/beta hydrolase [Marivita sp. S6314]MCK0150253.1 alpha/beta hydrolase [Marivita sp. S6314]